MNQLFLGTCKAKITSAPNKKISQAVQISMQIEGYKPTQSAAIKRASESPYGKVLR
jgi:hypothetical protein